VRKLVWKFIVDEVAEREMTVLVSSHNLREMEGLCDHIGILSHGHMVIEKDGRQCSCGRKGCLEAYCSATALVKLTKEKFEVSPDSLMREMCENDINRVGGKTAFAAMKKGDKAGAEVVETYLSYLACGVANLINIFQPEVFTIGGGVSGEGDNLIVPLKAKVAKETYSKDNTLKSDLRIAKLGNDAGIIGAAAFATR
jgi:glucokinase